MISWAMVAIRGRETLSSERKAIGSWGFFGGAAGGWCACRDDLRGWRSGDASSRSEVGDVSGLVGG